MNGNMNPSGDPAAALDSAEYQLIVAPVLQVAAELAAARGDPDLFNDLSSMLMLRAIIRQFGQWYLDEEREVGAGARAAIAAAADSVSAMALQRGRLDQDQMGDCMWALEAAGRLVGDAKLFDPMCGMLRTAWEQLRRGERDQAAARLKLAARGMVAAVDRWERDRDTGTGEGEAAAGRSSPPSSNPLT